MWLTRPLLRFVVNSRMEKSKKNISRVFLIGLLITCNIMPFYDKIVKNTVLVGIYGVFQNLNLTFRWLRNINLVVECFTSIFYFNIEANINNAIMFLNP